MLKLITSNHFRARVHTMAVVEGTAFEIEIENEENGLRNKHPDIILVKRLCFNDFLQQKSQNLITEYKHFAKETKKTFFNSSIDQHQLLLWNEEAQKV